MNPPAEKPRPPTPATPATATPMPADVVAEPAIDPNQLTPEEQMALYEKDLKENDWGHQPC